MKTVSKTFWKAIELTKEEAEVVSKILDIAASIALEGDNTIDNVLMNIVDDIYYKTNNNQTATSIKVDVQQYYNTIMEE